MADGKKTRKQFEGIAFFVFKIHCVKDERKYVA